MASIGGRDLGFARPGPSGRALVGAVASLGTIIALGYAIAYEGRIGTAVLALPVAALGIAVVAQRPKVLIGMVVVFSLFDDALSRLTHIHALVNLDDASVAAAVVILPLLRLVSGRRLRNFPGLIWFASFALLGAIGSYFHNVPLGVGVPGGFLALKGVAVGFAAAQLDWRSPDVKRFARYSGWISAFAILCVVANFLAPSAWVKLVGNGTVDHRLGLVSPIGAFVHPGALSIVMALIALAALSYSQTMASSSGSMLLGLASLATCFLSLRRTAFIAFAAAIGVIRLRKNRTATVVVGICVATLAVVLLGSELKLIANATYSAYSQSGQNAQPRTLLYKGSVTLAQSTFPLGVGFGRYGSYVAISHYSPEYYKLDFNRVWGLQPPNSGSRTNSSFGSDTSWPAVIAETGWIGFAAYGLGLLSILRIFRYATRERTGWVAFVGLLGVGWWVDLLIESIANPIFVGPPTYPLLFVLAGIAYVLVRDRSHQAETITP